MGPFNQIQSATHAKILGRHIHIKGEQSHAVKHRMAQSQKKTWQKLKRPIFPQQINNQKIQNTNVERAGENNTNICTKHTSSIQERQQLTLDKYTSKRRRGIYGPKWVFEIGTQ